MKMSQIVNMISPKLALVICVRFLGIINKIIKHILIANKLEMTQRVKKIKIIILNGLKTKITESGSLRLEIIP